MERKEKMNLEKHLPLTETTYYILLRCLSRDMDMRWCRRRKN